MEKKKIIKFIKKQVNKYKIEWHNRLSPFQILIGTVLSQRTKDENTRKATTALFKYYKTPTAIANAPLGKLEKLIRPSGFYKVKAKRIKEISKILLKKYNGKVPKEFDELINLPGVGRKTANCVLCFGYRIPAIPVDVHVHRVSNRIGLVKTKTPEQTEHALMKIVPKKYWIDVNKNLVIFGQRICLSRKPLCYKCSIVRYCKYKNKNL